MTRPGSHPAPTTRSPDGTALSVETLHALLASVAEIVSIVDAGGIRRYVNPAVERLMGYRPDELIGKPVNVLGAAERADMLQAFLAEVRATPGRSDAFEHRVRHRDGSSRWLETYAENRLDDPAIAGIVLISRDITARRVAQDAGARWTAIAESSDVAIVGRAMDGTITSWNLGAERLYGYTAAEAIGRSVAMLRLPSQAEELARLNEHLDQGKRIEGLEARRMTKDGRVIDVLLNIAPIQDANGNVVGVSAVALDITERKRAADRLHEAEQRFRTLVEQIPAVTYISTPRTAESPATMPYASPQIEAMLGYKPEEWDIATWKRSLHPEDRDRAMDEDEATDLSGEPYTIEYRLIARDGRVVWVRDRALLRRNETDDSVFWQGIMLDITEEKEAEAALRTSEERFRALVQNAGDLISVTDAGGTIAYQSPAVERILGYRPEEHAGIDGCSLIHPDDLPLAGREHYRIAATPGASTRFEIRVRHRDGSWRWLEVTSTNLLHEPSIGGFVVNSRDITERKQAEEVRAHLAAIVESSDDAIVSRTIDGRIASWNPGAERLYGFTEAEAIGQPIAIIIPPDRIDEPAALMQHLLAGGYVDHFETEGIAKDGRRFDLSLTVSPLRTAGGEMIGAATIARDITARKAIEARLAHQAYHDPLTGLANRTRLAEWLGAALERVRLRTGNVAVLYLDLDRFKGINDGLGHEAGDAVLVEVGRRLSGCLPEKAMLARVGGDEFIAAIEGISSAGARAAADRLLSALRAPMTVDGSEIFLDASLGIVLNGPGFDSVGELLRAADIAAYQAKRQGRGIAVVFEPGMSVRPADWLALEGDLRHAIEREQFRLYYQPIVDLATGQIAAVEALLRWQHPTRGFITPADFIPLAEETGLIVPIGAWALGEACRQLREWQRTDPESAPPMVNVNLAARQLRDPGLIDDVAIALAAADLPADRLRLEIHEQTLMDELESRADTLRTLRELGVRLAIDDFGAGASSLRHLRTVETDMLKLDLSFARRLSSDAGDRAVVAAVTELAHALDMVVTAEGIETPEQRDAVYQAGCDLAQGYLFSHPVPSADLRQRLARGTSRILPTDAEPSDQALAQLVYRR